ncbi:MAG: ribosome maturation factor RimP [Miltoncostaeaceae bacterium]
MSDAEIESTVEAALARELPDVDLREVRVLAGREPMVRVVVDRAAGVDHGLCVDVTRALEAEGLRERHGIEVSSPGPEPPLRTTEHFRAVLGGRISLRLEEDGSRPRDRTATLLAVSGEILSVRFGDAGDPIDVPIHSVRRARSLANDHAPLAGARGGVTA